MNITDEMVLAAVQTYCDKSEDQEGARDMRAAIEAALSAQPQTVAPNFPELLSEDEKKSMLREAEILWKDLEENKLGGFSCQNRPFYIVHAIKRAIEKYGHRDVGLNWSKDALDAARSALATAPAPAHADDTAVDHFSAAMKEKLAKKRLDGRSGWEDKDDCSQLFISQLLREHVEKGDPVDVGNLAMMLHQREERIASLLEILQGE
ncbi:hypothetical protein [Agrobacterium vitis]|nr:hypothetical protein [Agrobacterium vitis]